MSGGRPNFLINACISENMACLCASRGVMFLNLLFMYPTLAGECCCLTQNNWKQLFEYGFLSATSVDS